MAAGLDSVAFFLKTKPKQELLAHVTTVNLLGGVTRSAINACVQRPKFN